MTRLEKNKLLILDALAGGKSLTLGEIVKATGLSYAATSRAIYSLRFGDVRYITVPTHRDEYRYMIAATVKDTLAGTLNQQRHALTRAESEIALGRHQLSIAATPQDVSIAELMVMSGTAKKAQAELVIKALSLVA